MLLINLLPWRQYRREQIQKHFIYSLVIAAISAVIFLIILYLLLIQIFLQHSHDNTNLQSQLEQLKQQTQIVDELALKEQALQAQHELITKLDNESKYPVNLSQSLLDAMPPGIHLTQLKYANATVELHGISTSSVEINSLLNNLNHSIIFYDAKLEHLKTAGADSSITQHFTIVAKTKL